MHNEILSADISCRFFYIDLEKNIYHRNNVIFREVLPSAFSA
ncbi:hypothetical protein AcetOrient_orf00303p (plasmid) [Acetobacter orientalis]|uniref:Uncharacterized protein n=1 Tax=Acetobacter orientalis TaxID=146474 RepID=A0A2Z5ZMW8_9PROT|nr:hypothetical protein AcetOrient_orf00303p [Acetobacter orientalis]